MITVYLVKCNDLQQAKDKILAQYSKYKGVTYSIEYLTSGAPQLIVGDVPNGYVSISHTDGLLAMAFSDIEVGVDLERADREVSSKVCESIEQWTRIEAYAKWTGRGLSRDMLFEKLPDDMITTKRFKNYIISVCAEVNDFKIIASV